MSRNGAACGPPAHAWQIRVSPANISLIGTRSTWRHVAEKSEARR